MSEKKTNFISAPKASKRYFYTTRTFTRWISQGNILGVKHANKWYVEENSLKQYINSCLS